MKFDAFSTGLAGGFTAAIFNLIIGLIAMLGDWGARLRGMTLQTQTPDIGLGEVLVGMLWGFIVFFILGALFASIYNSFSRRIEITRHA